MKKIILDTNFLLIPDKFKVDIFSEIDRICTFGYNLFIIDKTIGELKKIIGNQKGKNKAAAKLALLLLKKKKIDVIKTKSGSTVDDEILKLNGCIVATQDKILKTRLRKKKIPVITLRQERYLIMA